MAPSSTAISSGSISVGSGYSEVTFSINSSNQIGVAFGNPAYTVTGAPIVNGWNAQPSAMAGGSVIGALASSTQAAIDFFDLDFATAMNFTGLTSGQNMAIALSLRLIGP